MPETVVRADKLRLLTSAIFERAGLPAQDATLVANALVWANLRGVDSHGITRIPRYLEMIKQGALNPKPNIKVVKQSGVAVVIDADRAAGPVGMMFGTSLALQRARQDGLGFGLVRRTTHTAALGFYVQEAVAEGCIGLAASASVPNMPYHGTRVASVSTSAFCIGVPSRGAAPLVLDIATSAVSLGRLALMKRAGTQLHADWAMDNSGAVTTDPTAAILPLPLGGPKGAGLSLMIECLASVLAENPIIAPVLAGGAKLHRQNSFILLIDVAKFCPSEIFRDNVQQMVQAIKSTPLAPGFEEILMPGERSYRTMMQRTETGIPVSASTWSGFSNAANAVGITIPTSFS
jgi:ureidoglycolate dehydrogenase (NAD+)